MEQVINDIKTFFTNAGLNLVIGIAIIILGLLLCKIVKVIVRKLMRRTKQDEAVISFVVAFTDVTLKIIVMVSALATMGVNTASLITVLGTCGVAIGLSLKDSLSNLASGMLIIFNKPFKKDDYIEVDGEKGLVESINLFYTTLITYDKKRIVVPNSIAANNAIINFDGCEIRRVDLPLYVPKGCDLEEVKRLVGAEVEKDERVSVEIPYSIRMEEQTRDYVTMMLKAHVRSELYWDVFYDLNEAAYNVLKDNGLLCPDAQVAVRMAVEKAAEERADIAVADENVPSVLADKKKRGRK